MTYVTVINEHQYLHRIVSGHHHLTADEAALRRRRRHFHVQRGTAEKAQQED